MATSEERTRILKMIADQQISAEEGAKLIEALRTTRDAPGTDEPAKARWLRVRVTDRRTGKSKLSVNIPVGLLDVGLKMGARFAPEMAGMDLSAVQAAIKGGMLGKIIELDDEDDDERVEIFVE